MEEKTSKDQYGRKSWNVAVYEEEAKKGKKTSEVSEIAKAAAQKLGADHLKHRSELLTESVAQVQKRTLIADSAAVGRKRFGFVCPICDLSFRDTLALVDHINSALHARKARELAKAAGTEDTGEVSNGIRHATAEEVSQVIEELVAKRLKARAASKSVESIQERVRRRAEFMERRRDKRREKRKVRKVEAAAEERKESEMASVMGFGGFGSTKVG